MMAFVTHVIALLAGLAGGWYGKGKWGNKVQTVEDAVKKL